MKKNLTIILLIATILLTATLALANRQYVAVNYLFGTFRVPLILLILVCVVLGIVIQFLLTLPKYMSNSIQLKQIRREMEDVQRVLGDKDKQEKKDTPAKHQA